LKNIKNNFDQIKEWKHDTDTVMKILKDRKELPEVSKFAMKVCLKNPKDKIRINSMITTLVKSNFIVRMFESIEDPKEFLYFITVDLKEEDLEKKAE